MALNIKIEDTRGIHCGFKLQLKPGFTALVGPNGAGKTTLLGQIKSYAEENKIEYWAYSNLLDGGEMAMNRYLLAGSMKQLASSMFSSEGEKLVNNFANRLGEMGKKVSTAIKSKVPIIILIDAVDSGISIDMARNIVEFLLSVEEIDVNKNGGEIYLLMAVNNYEFAKSPADCVNVRSGEHMIFNSYDEYADFICNFFPEE